MKVKLEKIVIKTKKMSEMIKFISEIFEAEMELTEEGAQIKNDFFFVLKKDKTPSKVDFEFSLASKDDFKNFYKRVHFFLYRLRKEELALTQDEEKSFFEFKDIEKRIWKFSYFN